ncbi:MAG: hypothetical protein ABSH41_03740 [Syntrophobacteraceae bacterium]|jgi:hypothetical protein
MKGKKTGGRKAGTPNKFTKIRHELLSGIEALGIKRLCKGAALESKLGVLRVLVSVLPREDTLHVPELENLVSDLSERKKRADEAE